MLLQNRKTNQKEVLGHKYLTLFQVVFPHCLEPLPVQVCLKVLLSILIMTGVLSAESGTYLILSATANAVFYFLPIFMGITISAKLGASPYVGGAIGAALLEPNFTNLLKHAGDTPIFLVFRLF